ncbi:hypothetical protein F5141DRAFT_1190128 [Pisolithus sp. B1]|nr:hypothetical protein F5141DRAFT_1190128 [Pisolithus sp. B1]
MTPRSTRGGFRQLDTKIKQEVLVTLASLLPKTGGFSFNLINTNLSIATLQAIGYVCESIKPEIMGLRSNGILTAVIHGARRDEPSSGVQLAAVHALYNSLEFMPLYYDKTAFYMEQALFGLTAVGFWTTVCEEETELTHEAREVRCCSWELNAKIALPEVVPVLALLTRQEEGADEDE